MLSFDEWVGEWFDEWLDEWFDEWLEWLSEECPDG